MKVLWTATAQHHLASIFDYIAKDSPEYALRTVDRLTRRTQQIALFPRSGRRVPEYDVDSVREVIEGSYRIVYSCGTQAIVILAVLHGARDIPPRE